MVSFCLLVPPGVNTQSETNYVGMGSSFEHSAHAAFPLSLHTNAITIYLLPVETKKEVTCVENIVNYGG